MLREILSDRDFDHLAERYRLAFGFDLICVDNNGQLVYGTSACPHITQCHAMCAAYHKRTVTEAYRWGEPCVNFCPAELAIWGMPIMRNSQFLGGLVVTGVALEPQSNLKGIQTACQELQKLVEEMDLTNSALLEKHRLEAQRARQQAEAIHDLHGHIYEDIREIYIREEPDLLAAIKKGERQKAREIINRVLVGVYFIGRDRKDLLKFLILELVVMMSRAAVEAGAEPTGILGANYRVLSDLANIDDEAALSQWVTHIMEGLMGAIQHHTSYPHLVLLSRALDFMRHHLDKKINRDEVARLAGMSPGHFSRMIKETTGKTFSDILTGYRVDRATDLLAHTDKSLVQIALECGFMDQSYFSRVFRKIHGRTPGEYRRCLQG